MKTVRVAPTNRVLTLSFGAALALSACAHKAPAPMACPVPPPAPVGHVYPVAVALPAPVSPRITFTPSQTEAAQQAFNVVGLKSALMVGALSCNQQTQYDAFMTLYQPHILDEVHVVDRYFRKASGPHSGQKMEDDFVTSLANDQSIAGNQLGSQFCLNSAAEFKAVLALKTNADLDSFVTDQAP